MNEEMNNIIETEHNPDLIEGTLSSQEITKPARGRPAKVDAQMFIETWEKADDLREVAALLGMPTTSASVRASNMRKSGVSLKQFRRGRKRKTA